MSVQTDLLVGSVEGMAAQSFTITSGAVTVATGNYYLRHTSVLKSLLSVVASALNSAGASNPLVVLQQDLKVKITFDVAEAITWGSATTLRDYLGFEGTSSASSTSHTATLTSPLIWSAGYRSTLATIAGIDGFDMDDTLITKSQSGLTTVATNHYTAVMQRFNWPAVPISRIHTTSENGGEFKAFRDNVLKPVARFVVYEDRTEDSTSTSTMSFDSNSEIGPYKITGISQINDWYKRVIANADTWSPVSLECVVVTDYS